VADNGQLIEVDQEEVFVEPNGDVVEEENIVDINADEEIVQTQQQIVVEDDGTIIET
jgi:hypothetical protein